MILLVSYVILCHYYNQNTSGRNQNLFSNSTNMNSQFLSNWTSNNIMHFLFGWNIVLQCELTIFDPIATTSKYSHMVVHMQIFLTENFDFLLQSDLLEKGIFPPMEDESKKLRDHPPEIFTETIKSICEKKKPFGALKFENPKNTSTSFIIRHFNNGFTMLFCGKIIKYSIFNMFYLFNSVCIVNLTWFWVEPCRTPLRAPDANTAI